MQAKLNLKRLWKPAAFPVVSEFFYFFSFLFFVLFGKSPRMVLRALSGFLAVHVFLLFSDHLFLLAVRY